MAEEKLAAQAEAALEQGMALHRQYRLDEAGVLYEQVLQADPENFRAVYLLGITALQKSDPGRAAALLARAAAIDPQSASAHNDHGRAQMLLGRMDEALATTSASRFGIAASSDTTGFQCATRQLHPLRRPSGRLTPQHKRN